MSEINGRVALLNVKASCKPKWAEQLSRRVGTEDAEGYERNYEFSELTGLTGWVSHGGRQRWEVFA